MKDDTKGIAIMLLADATYKRATQPLYYARWMTESEPPKEIKRPSFIERFLRSPFAIKK